MDANGHEYIKEISLQRHRGHGARLSGKVFKKSLGSLCLRGRFVPIRVHSRPFAVPVLNLRKSAFICGSILSAVNCEVGICGRELLP
jgi:hypothetical protein